MYVRGSTCSRADSKLFIVGSSANGFGWDRSDVDLCLVIPLQELPSKTGAKAVLRKLRNLLLQKLREVIVGCAAGRVGASVAFGRAGGKAAGSLSNCERIRANVPILKLHDQLSGFDCYLSLNNVVGIYNTHLLAMYARVDRRVPALGMFVKHWAQRMGIHGGSKRRLSTYALVLMVIQYLQCGCSPPVVPNLQARFPKIFDCERALEEVDMDLELPWEELRSANRYTSGELFAGFIAYYANFDFARWNISICNGSSLKVSMGVVEETVMEACPIDIYGNDSMLCFASGAVSILLHGTWCGKASSDVMYVGSRTKGQGNG
ncbi:Poly(A) RNA polymerase gld-2 B [Echinococcus granulosus]|uniref:Poly(A) RNA polymerase gld-2 B n=1 Tax=Echinococcus granulosus TaxID=6210 RepID=W6U1Y2_ECHGR|nr:Poly(A) RNA polymerase gld-2 B [Echinococcus granulosus]EUB55115.1 Poly(A) RNA polymerase gld-2 B [Echinococcus granulosus]